MILYFALYALFGIIAGLLAGLLGIGGGLVIVPILNYMFTLQGFPPEHIMHMALGTSLASIMFTSVSSALSHHRHGAVNWDIVKKVSLGIIIGTNIGSFIAAKIPTFILQLIFSCFIFYVASQMIFSAKKTLGNKPLPGTLGMNAAGLGIGLLSSLVGIGGGTISVPFMLYHSVEMRKAIATSAAIGIPIAISGCFGYFINGNTAEHLPEYSFGFIYIPALIALVLCSTVVAPYGAHLAHTLPVAKIKKFFAVLLLVVGLRMLFGAGYEILNDIFTDSLGNLI